MPVGVQLSLFAESCSKLRSFRICNSSTSLVHVPVVVQRLVPMGQTVQLVGHEVRGQLIVSMMSLVGYF